MRFLATVATGVVGVVLAIWGLIALAPREASIEADPAGLHSGMRDAPAHRAIVVHRH